MEPMEDLILFPALFLLIGWVAWLIFRRIRFEQEARLRQLDLQRELVRKFESPESLMTFLRTEEGRRCFPVHPQGPSVKTFIRHGVIGLVLLAFGGVMIGQGYAWKGYTDINFITKMQDYFYWGNLTIAAGGGLLLYVLLAYMHVRRNNSGRNAG